MGAILFLFGGLLLFFFYIYFVTKIAILLGMMRGYFCIILQQKYIAKYLQGHHKPRKRMLAHDLGGVWAYSARHNSLTPAELKYKFAPFAL